MSAENMSPLSNDAPQRMALRKGMDSMHGYAAFAFLGDVYNSARRFGFTGTMADALWLLTDMSEVTIERSQQLPDSRVTSGEFMPLRHLGVNGGDGRNGG